MSDEFSQPDQVNIHGRGFVPWYKQPGAWVTVGAVVVVSALAMVIGMRAVNDRTAAGIASETPSPSVTKSAAADEGGQVEGDYERVANAECPKPSQAPVAEDGKPAGATKAGGITLGCDGVPGGPVAPGTKVTVEVMSDFICPYCQKFEQQVGPELEQAMRDGQVKLTIYPLGYLDGYSTSEYSSRAARASVAVAALDPEHFWAFDRLLWENQPAEGGPGLSDDEIADLARQAGVAEKAIAAFTTGAYDAWVTQTTANVTGTQGFQGTPWVLIGDGENMYAWNWSQGDLQTAIAKVAVGEQP
jgi:protein-disulfide isomerase